MILCLDIGNSQVFGGVFAEDKIQLRFRYPTQRSTTSDQLGIFLKHVLRENSVDCKAVKQIAICSVVPSMDYSLRSACIKYFHIDPFMLQAGVKTGLKIKYRNPLEVGADRIADAIAAYKQFPQQNIIVIDMGTATTFSAISQDKEYLGGAILPGIRLSMESLSNNTAKLFTVEIVRPEAVVGRSTMESIQAGLYYSQLGAIREITQCLTQEVFANQKPLLIGTGGFAYLFEEEKIFDAIIPDLILQGLKFALEMNVLF